MNDDEPLPSVAEQVAEATGLAGMLAQGVVRRSCGRAGIDVDRMKPRDIEKLLPPLEAVLLVYLSPVEADAAMHRIRRVAKGKSGASGVLRLAISDEDIKQATDLHAARAKPDREAK